MTLASNWPLTGNRKILTVSFWALCFCIPAVFFAFSVFAAPVPAVSLAASTTTPFIGNSMTITATFDNNGPAGDTGYGPFIDLVFPRRGADGDPGATTPVQPVDGISFGTATYMGVPVTTYTLTFPDPDGNGPLIVGTVTHPLAVNNLGVPLTVSGNAGDTLVVVQLPFGSFVTDQPPADVIFTANVSNMADVGTALTFRARAGFQYGADALNNPTTDPSILSQASTNSTTWAPSQSVTPQVITVDKASESGLTGKNFHRQYTITINIAPGETIDGNGLPGNVITITDTLPSDMVYLGATAAGGTITVQPTLNAIIDNVAPTNNTLTVTYASLTGGPHTITVDFYVPEADYGGTPVIPRATADDSTSDPNSVTVTGSWTTPTDPRDIDISGAFSQTVNNITRTDMSMILDKSVTVVGGGAVVPGAILRHTLTIGVSDYFAFQNLIIDDTINDGHRWYTDATYMPTLSLVEHRGNLAAATMNAANYTVTPHYSAFGDTDTGDGNSGDATDGTTDFQFRLSDEIISRGLDGKVLGGCVPALGTGGSAANCGCTATGGCGTPATNTPPTVTFVYYTQIQQYFSDYFPAGNSAVDQGDILNNTAVATGNVLNVTNLNPNGNTEQDGAAVQVQIAVGALGKELYAINGGAPLPGATIEPGDRVTYRITYQLPTHNFENLFLTDYLPLPVFDATEVATFDNVAADATIPLAGHAKFGPSDTFRAFLVANVFTLPDTPGPDVYPVLSTSGPQNTVTFTYGDYNDTLDSPVTIDILFTVTVTTEPYATGLLLTNQSAASESSTAGTTTATSAIKQIILDEPLLTIDKSITGSSNPAGVIAGGNITNSDAGDVITFTVTAENPGDAPAYDVTFREPAVAGLGSCAVSSVTVDPDGPGASAPAAVAYTGDMFTTNLVLTNPVPATGIIAVTYTCTLANTVTPRQVITNEAFVDWAAFTGATKFGEISDTATITVADPAILSKSVFAITPGPASPNVVPGDVITYQLNMTIPEGATPGLTITDNLPGAAGFDYVAGSVAVTFVGSGVTLTNNPPLVGGTALAPVFNFGDVIVTSTGGSTNNTVILRYNVLVRDDAVNNIGIPLANKTNTASLNFTGNPGGPITASRTVLLGEPRLTITKAITNPAPPLHSGDLVTFSLTVQNTGTAPAFDVRVTDVLNEGAASNALLDLSTVAALSTPAGYTYNYASPTVTYTQSDGTNLAAGGSVTFTFTANVSNSAVSSSTYTNTAAVIGDSQENIVPEDRDTSGTGTMPAVTIAAPTVAKSAVVSADTSQAHTANTNVAIGETFTYRLTFTLPKALTRNVILSDVMNNANSWAGVTLVAATLARSNVSLSSVNNPNSINTAGAGVPVDVLAQIQTCPIVSLPNCPVARMFSLPLGNVDNSSGSVGGDTYTLAITQRVNNVATNIDTRALQDLARFYYNYYPPSGVDTQVSIASAVRTVTVRQPVVDVAKSVLPASPAAGDTATYTLTITNTNSNVNADGFDWTFQDVLPLQLKNAGSIVLLPGGTGATINASFSGDNTVGWTLSGTIDRLDELESVQVTYQAQIDPATPFSSTLSNLATAQATTIPSGSPDDAFEAKGTEGIFSNLADSVIASLTTSTPTLLKGVIGLQARYAIGDIPHYQLTMNIPVGTSTGMVITDQLPAGLAFLNAGAYVPVITLPAGITTSSNTVTESGGLVTVTLGTVTAASAGAITIDYYAQVENVADNQEGWNLTNNAIATYNNPNIPPGGTLSTPAVSRTITVGEPVLAMAKTLISGGVGADAGSVVRWQFTAGNTGTTTAFQTDIRDQLPNGIDSISLVSLSTTGAPILDSGGNPVDSGDVAISTTVNTNDTLSLSNIRIPSGSQLTIVFDAVVMNTVVPAQVLNNVVAADFASQQTGSSGTSVVRDGADGIGGALNDYAQSASNPITIRSNIAIDKQADKTTATIGEEVIYTIRVSLIQGVTPSVSVSDTLPAGLTYVSHVISVGNMGMTFGNALYNTRLGAGQVVAFNMGNVTNLANGNSTDDYFDVAITARVDNDILNQNGDILYNGAGGTVTVTYGTVPSTVTYDYDLGTPGIQGRPLTLTEPELVVSKTAVPTVQALGSVVTYEITVMHDSGSTEDAWDLVLDDVLPTGMTYVPGSVTLPPADVTVAGQNLQFRISSLTTIAHDITFYYSATVDNSAAVGVPLINNIDLVWSSLSGATGTATSGRTGDDGPGNVLNNYATDDNASVTPATPAFIRAPKTVAIAVGGGDGQLDPLDTLEYTIVLNNAGVSQATNVVYTDAIPANTTYVAASLTTTQGAIVPGFPLQVNVGTMDPGDTVTITFRVTVNAGTPDGTVISNQGLVDSDQTVPRPTDVDDIDANGLNPTDIIVGPRPSLLNPLYVEKRITWAADNDSSGSVTPGDRLSYTLIVDNLGSTTLTGINITDTIPSGLTYVGGTLVVTQEVAPNAGILGQALTWPVGTLASGAWAAAVFDVTIDAPLPGSVNTYTFTNQGSADSNETTPIPTDGNGNPSDGYQPTSITAVDGIPGTADLDVQKRYTVAVDVGGDGYASPGDTLEYQIFITNAGSSPLHDVRIDDDPIPANTTIVAGSVYTSQGVVLSEDPVTVNIGTVNPGDVITVRFRVLIDTNPPNLLVVDGLILSNQANVTSTELPDELSDDNGVPGDGVNPDPTLTPIRVGASTVGAPTDLTKGLIEADTSESGIAVPNVLIGEVLTYEVSVTMPEGLLRQVTLKDTLPVGLVYVGNAELARVFTTGITAASNPGNVNTAASTVFVPVTLTQSGQDLSLFLGDVINSDADVDAEGYVLRYDVVVANIAANQAGTVNTNSVTLTYQDALGAGQTLLPTSLPVTVTVAEPNIQMTLIADLAEIPAAGGTVTFTLVITNPGGANVGPGYDVNITDLLPAGYSNIVVATIIPSGGVAGGGNITDSSTAAGLDVMVGAFPANGVLTIVFTVEAAPAETEADLTYTANVIWTSVPGTNGTGNVTPGAPGTSTGERNGSDGVGGALNDYMATDDVMLTYKPARRAIRFENTVCTACNSGCTDPNEHYVSVPDSGNLDLTTSGTIEAWIQATSCAPEDVDAGIVMKGDNVSGPAYGFGLAGGTVFAGGTSQNIGFRVGNTVLVATNNTLTPGKWYHVACSWNAAAMNIYINGILEATGPASAAVPNGIPLTIGIQHVSATPVQYYGNVEEFRVWNTARTIGDIRNDMCRTLNLLSLPGNLVCYLQYNEYSGTQVKDAAGGANGAIVDAFHVCSEAPLGDDSVWNYTAGSYTVTMMAGSDTMSASPFTGTWDAVNKSGIQMYRVDDAPEPSVGPMGSMLFNSRGYWGVFVTGGVDPSYSVTYTYDEAGIGDENNLKLTYRHQGCAPWMDLDATLDTGANTLIQTGLAGTEFILGSLVDPRNAIDFDGVDDFVDVPDDTSLDLTTIGTLETWIYISVLTPDAGIINKGDTTNGYSLYTDTVTGNQIVLTLYNGIGVNDTVISAATLNPGIWYHVAATWDGTNMNLYINGILDSGSKASAQASGNPTGNNLTIGIGNGTYFQGRIDEVRVWDTAARTLAEIQTTMCQKLAGTEANLKGYWRFDEETASAVCPDFTLNNNDGNMTNFADVRVARICSSAPIGDYSAFNYGAGASTVSLNPTGDPLRVTANGGTWAAGSGIHVYRLDEAPVYGPDLWTTAPYTYTSPNGLTPPDPDGIPGNGDEWSSIDYYRYFGVFVTDPNPVAGPIYDVVYNYNANPMTPQDDSVIGLARRPEYCFGTWNDPGASVTLDTTANTLTFASDTQNGLPKQNPEYILGGKDAPLSIALASFTATATDGCVDIAWETATEINAAGFHVWRSDNPLTGFVRINNGLIPSKSVMETMGAKYSFSDCGVEFSRGNNYYYLLEEVEIDGMGSGNMNGPIGPVSENISAAQSTSGSSNSNCFIDSLNYW